MADLSSYILSTNSGCRKFGILILLFFSSRPFSIVVCSLKFQNVCISSGTSFIYLDYPLFNVYFSRVRVSSLFMTSMMHWICKLLAQTAHVIQFIEILES